MPKPTLGRIEFDHVWFSYDGEEWVLRDVSFVIEPGHDGNIILYPADFFTILARWKVFHIGVNRCRQAGVHIAGRLAVGRPEVIFKRQDPSRRRSISRIDRQPFDDGNAILGHRPFGFFRRAVTSIERPIGQDRKIEGKILFGHPQIHRIIRRQGMFADFINRQIIIKSQRTGRYIHGGSQYGQTCLPFHKEFLLPHRPWHMALRICRVKRKSNKTAPVQSCNQLDKSGAARESGCN